MDDITLSGLSHVEAADFSMIKTEGAPERLILNEKKCEAITLEGQTIEPVLQKCIHLTPAKSMLLEAPLIKGQAMDYSLSSQCNDNRTSNITSWANKCS